MGAIKKQCFGVFAAVFFLMMFCAAAVGAAETVGQININEATVEELTDLEGVGPGYAQKIVEYRKENGPFDKPEDIMKVKGIGDKIWETNKDRIKTK
ncbi:ComEA family DNA-binding protein [Desulfatiglans anilini]|uniref:ComEA family DNA-binding protein n=1 Tax=Desulfatiglans anilini TaxID=90728 RepID=UPI0003F7F4DB|nr:helix-hairpin-helix domain-containing protein [Desulfatiglans anilini]